MRHGNRRVKPKGFTLVEVIVVLVILAILAAIMIPAMTGWIDKARERAAIAACRTCVVAAQTLASEQYAEVGTVNVRPDEVQGLARIGGSVDRVSIARPAFVDALIYTDPNSITVTYLRRPQPHYVFGAGSADASFGALGGAFAQLQNGTLKRSDGTEYKGKKIDGFEAQTPNTFAKALFDTLDPAQQAFLSGVSWSIHKTTLQGQELFRIYFTEDKYDRTESAENVKVYKYDMETGKYQYNLKGKVEEGVVKPDGNKWSEWSDTMD